MVLALAEQSNFAAGQIDTAAQRDKGKAVYQAGCIKARNMRILMGGAIKRRPASWRRATLAGQADGVEFVSLDGTVYILVLSNARLDVYSTAGAIVQTITGLVWTTAELDTLYLDRSLGKMIVSHHDFLSKVIAVDSAGTWTVTDFTFDDAFSGGPAQPYWRYIETKGITLQPSGLTGSITLTASAALFQDAGAVTHVGAYFRYLGRPILITAVGSSTSAIGTVVTKLPPTVTFTVDNAEGFTVGEEGEGLDSEAKGIITGISSNTITFVYSTNFDALKSGETFVGGSSASQAKLTADPSPATSAAVVDWDEQAFSPVRGYPGCGSTHRGRFYFLDMRDLPRGICASAAGLPNYFLVGDRDGDAFFEELPDYKGQRGRHVVTADQGLVLTDKAAYYLPETTNQPVTPSTIGFKFIAPIGATAARPVPTEQGFAYIEEGANRVIGILPTGSIGQPWQAQDLSTFWGELLTGPVALGTNEATTGFPERYGFALNTDGSAACVAYQSPNAPVPLGWTPWDTANAKFHRIFPAGGSMWAIVQHTTPAAWTLEQFDDSIYVDCAQAYTYVSGTPSLPFYTSTTIVVMDAASPWWYRGSFAVDGSGNVVGWTLPAGDYVVGYDIATELKPISPTPDHAAYIHGQRIGIPTVWVQTETTGAYTISGQDSPPWRTGETNTIAPPLRTEAKRWKIPGRASDLAPDITQSIPAPLQIGAIQYRVSI